jgi:hypothetical protein
VSYTEQSEDDQALLASSEDEVVRKRFGPSLAKKKRLKRTVVDDDSSDDSDGYVPAEHDVKAAKAEEAKELDTSEGDSGAESPATIVGSDDNGLDYEESPKKKAKTKAGARKAGGSARSRSKGNAGNAGGGGGGGSGASAIRNSAGICGGGGWTAPVPAVKQPVTFLISTSLSGPPLVTCVRVCTCVCVKCTRAGARVCVLILRPTM